MTYTFEKIENKFSKLDWQNRYKFILELAKTLPELKEQFKVKDNLVKGCQSQVWLVCESKQGKLCFKIDSDALIVRGLIVIVLSIYNQKTPQEILNTSNESIQKLGLDKYLTQTRTGGLASIIKQIKFYALAHTSIKSEI